MRRPLRAGATLTAALLVAGALSGAAAAPRPAAFCIPIPMIWSCPSDPSSPSPVPTPSPSPSGSSLLPGIPDIGAPTPGSTSPAPGEAPATPAPSTPAPVEAVPDEDAPVFTQPPAQLGSQSLSFTGLKGISIVTVPLADGSRVAAVKIAADSITIDGFALTVRHDDSSPSLVTTADRMTLSGNVRVYLNSLTATTQSGRSVTLGADTPPPADGVEPTLLRVTFGLVGATADSIVYSNTDQQLHG
ncbi:hypothetical protein [Microbacterium sp. SORGH_AS_0888]|uniref:hypothetical protein n=1 Tax=Microbacterium sp. SORGH_AS_0888 TaxID=3041791 RepID=UPI00278AF422|nr:hypothetical protein [Microbacterium sp. SORGH_AS_0888]MDQ1131113.1 hypothetical protein [Microbacterium sp. SORGH_AS_0888]